MRHADVCTCRDCGVARLEAIMSGMPDEEGKLILAVVGIKLGCEPLRIEQVALPYEEVLAMTQRMEAKIALLQSKISRFMPDPECGGADDLISSIESDLRTLRDSWRRDP
jgi:hypothetical protein